jgi:hypothetical protein
VSRTGHFATDAATKRLWLVLANITLKWVPKADSGGPAVLHHFAIRFSAAFAMKRDHAHTQNS